MARTRQTADAYLGYTAADSALASADTSIIGSFPTLITGLTLARTGATTFSVAAGMAANSEGTPSTRLLRLLASMSKSLSAWAVGDAQGALDTGTVANNTWYHVWLIRRDSDGLHDVLISTSATAPTMPSGWTNRRRIGAIRTDGSAQIVPFLQTGNVFRWVTPPLDVNVTTLGAARSLYTLTVPTGVQVLAQFRVRVSNAAAFQVIVQETGETDAAPSVTAAPLTDLVGAAGASIYANLDRMTDASSQIAARSSGATTTLLIATLGWVDWRGM